MMPNWLVSYIHGCESSDKNVILYLFFQRFGAFGGWQNVEVFKISEFFPPVSDLIFCSISSLHLIWYPFVSCLWISEIPQRLKTFVRFVKNKAIQPLFVRILVNNLWVVLIENKKETDAKAVGESILFYLTIYFLCSVLYHTNNKVTDCYKTCFCGCV